MKHVQTEKTLTNQAKQLLDVASVATKDVDKLHETITRRKNYDQNNREACKNLDANLSANFNVLSNNNNAYKSALNDQTSSLINKMSMANDLRVCAYFTTKILYVISFFLSFRQQYKTKQRIFRVNDCKFECIDRC